MYLEAENITIKSTRRNLKKIHVLDAEEENTWRYLSCSKSQVITAWNATVTEYHGPLFMIREYTQISHKKLPCIKSSCSSGSHVLINTLP